MHEILCILTAQGTVNLREVEVKGPKEIVVYSPCAPDFLCYVNGVKTGLKANFQIFNFDLP